MLTKYDVLINVFILSLAQRMFSNLEEKSS